MTNLWQKYLFEVWYESDKPFFCLDLVLWYYLLLFFFDSSFQRTLPRVFTLFGSHKEWWYLLLCQCSSPSKVSFVQNIVDNFRRATPLITFKLKTFSKLTHSCCDQWMRLFCADIVKQNENKILNGLSITDTHTQIDINAEHSHNKQQQKLTRRGTTWKGEKTNDISCKFDLLFKILRPDKERLLS